MSEIPRMNAADRSKRFLDLDEDQRIFFGLYLSSLIDMDHADPRACLREAFEVAEAYSVGMSSVG